MIIVFVSFYLVFILLTLFGRCVQTFENVSDEMRLTNNLSGLNTETIEKDKKCINFAWTLEERWRAVETYLKILNNMI